MDIYLKGGFNLGVPQPNLNILRMPKTFSQIWTSFQNTALMAFQPVLQRMNEIANSEAFQTFVNNAVEGLAIVAGDYADLSNYGAGMDLGGIGSGVDDIAGNTGAIADNMDITEEDLKYLRDIAEQEAVNRFTIAEVNIDQSGMQNHISSGMDLDGLITGLTDSVNEAVDIITEGVHE